MRNQLRADYYKLRHSSLFWIVGGLVIVIFALLCKMSIGSDQVLMGFAREYIGIEPVVDGFVAFAYEDPLNPTFWEVVYSAMALTFYLWLVLLVLAVQFYSKEFTTGTIKLSIAYGKNRLMLFFSKLIVIISYFGILYYLFTFLGYLVCVKQAGVALTVDGIMAVLKLTTLYFMVLVVFTMTCMFLCNVIQNSVMVTTSMIVAMYSTVFLILGVFERKPSPILQAYFNINPMYYLWKLSGFWAYPRYVTDTITYFVGGIITLTICTYVVQEKKEVE